MSRSTLSLTDELRDYILGVTLREHPLLKALRKETAEHPEAKMQISPDQGQFMATLLRLINARSVLEIGTFTGYSALAMILALPSDGHLTACDVSENYTEIARKVSIRKTHILGHGKLESFLRMLHLVCQMMISWQDGGGVNVYRVRSMRLLRGRSAVLPSSAEAIA